MKTVQELERETLNNFTRVSLAVLVLYAVILMQIAYVHKLVKDTNDRIDKIEEKKEKNIFFDSEDCNNGN